MIRALHSGFCIWNSPDMRMADPAVAWIPTIKLRLPVMWSFGTKSELLGIAWMNERTATTGSSGAKKLYQARPRLTPHTTSDSCPLPRPRRKVRQCRARSLVAFQPFVVHSVCRPVLMMLVLGRAIPLTMDAPTVTCLFDVASILAVT